jgi:hypothetical protein
VFSSEAGILSHVAGIKKSLFGGSAKKAFVAEPGAGATEPFSICHFSFFIDSDHPESWSAKNFKDIHEMLNEKRLIQVSSAALISMRAPLPRSGYVSKPKVASTLGW